MCMKKIIILTSLIIIIGSGCNNTEISNPTKTTNQNTNTITTQTNTTTINKVNEKIMTSTTKKSDSSEKEEDKKAVAPSVDILKQYDQAILKTSAGDITVKFYNNDSPNTVKNFLTLAQKDFYNNTKFHRVIKDFMIQGGDPLSKNDDRLRHGTGGPDYRFEDEFNKHKLVKGSLAMANSGPNTNGSQFFIVTAPATSWLDGKHTNFGHVVVGMDIVEKIEKTAVDSRDNPVEPITINSIILQHSK